MKKHCLPYDKNFIVNLDEQFGTPFLIFDEKAIIKNLYRLYDAFSWVPNFKNYYAVKSHPNPFVMEILKKHGCGMDCSSMGELILSESIGNLGEDIMFSSNNTPAEDFKKARDLGAIINFDDISHIDYYKKNVGELPELVCCRYNPGNSKIGGNVIIGLPSEAKYGFTKEQIIEGYKILKESGVKRFGLHTMVMSNDINKDSLVETASLLLHLLLDIEEKVGIEIEFINLGGGIGIPYKPQDEEVDIFYVSGKIKELYNNLIDNSIRKKPLNIIMEQGRFITGPYAELVSKVIHLKHIYRDYVGLDSSMVDFMRPGVYGAYHHLTVLGKENNEKNHIYDVTGSLCENNDKFAIQRQLPLIEVGDYIALHDAGAHGYAMGFNYNAKLRCKELLIKENGEVIQTRRAQNLHNYFSTLDYPGLNKILKEYFQK